MSELRFFQVLVCLGRNGPKENFIKICERLNELNISPIIIGHSSEADFSKFIETKLKLSI